MNVVFVGRGKVGTSLARAARRAGHATHLVQSHAPRIDARADLIVVAVRDGALEDVARRLAQNGVVPRAAAVVHVAGALSVEVLAPLRGRCAGVGQMHPLLSFADARRPPALAGAHALCAGDHVARARAVKLARSLSMVPRRWRVDPALYHAAAGLLANGAAALAAASATLLVRGGAPAGEVCRALGPLLASVAANVERLGVPYALTGPVRRGDARAVRSHLRAIARAEPGLVQLYRALARAQLPLAEALGEAGPAALARVRAALDASSSRRGKH